MTQAVDLTRRTMHHPKRILIVDDIESTRRGLKALLAQSPECEVVGEAANGQEALQWLAQNPADVVVMDIRMPLMDGLTATQKLRSQGSLLKIIILSVSAANRDAALAAGADAFVNKIGSPYTLLTALHQLVAESGKISTETK